MLNNKEETYLVKLLIDHNINLNEEIYEQRAKIDFYRNQNGELKEENKKLKDRLNSLYSKIDAYNLVKEITS